MTKRKQNLFGMGKRASMTRDELQREKEKDARALGCAGQFRQADKLARKPLNSYARQRGVKIANPPAGKKAPGRRRNLDLDQVEAQKQKGVEFLRKVGSDESADRLEDEPVESYAMRKGIRIDENPRGKKPPAKPQAKAKPAPAKRNAKPALRKPAAKKKPARRRKPNSEGGGLEQAEKLYQQFQGRKPKDVLEIQQREVYQKNYAKLGDLVSLVVLDASQKKKRIKFSDADGVMLASNPAGTQLYFLGGNQDVRTLIEPLGADATKDLVELGPCVEVEYFTRKAFDQFQPVRYYHHLGEETGDVPVLCFDQLNRQLFFVGGAYYVRPEGIRN